MRMTNKGSSIAHIIRMIETLPDTSTRPMFGYQCYSVAGKFFAGFGKKNDLIIRLSKEDQVEALKDTRLKIRPFSHGAKMGWVQVDVEGMSKNETVLEWIKKGYANAHSLSKNG